MISKIISLLLRILGFGARPNLGARVKYYRTRMRFNRQDRVSVGDDSFVEAFLVTDRSPAEITIGARTFIGRSRLIAAKSITIGDDVLISWDVTIVDHDSHALDFALRANDVVEWSQGRKDWRHVAMAPVTVCDKAWIGFGVSILKGITVGEGAVIAAKSVVTKDVPPWTLVGGNPARVIRTLTPVAG